MKIDSQNIDKNLIWGTSSGLKKTSNEDLIGAKKLENGNTRFCIVDGHWGKEAAELVFKYWMNLKSFPDDRSSAIEKTQEIEQVLFEKFGSENMDENKDLTPETSFIAFELQDKQLRIVSYGDCRLLITKQEKIIYELPTTATWLGAFSHLKLRNRVDIEEALVFKELDLESKNKIISFSDGVDECVYETPTLSWQEIAILSNSNNLDKIFTDIFEKVEGFGAEDNASLMIKIV